MTPTRKIACAVTRFKRSVVTVSSFAQNCSLDELRTQLSHLKCTGKLVVHLSQGGINEVRFEAEEKLGADNHVELKFESTL